MNRVGQSGYSTKHGQLFEVKFDQLGQELIACLEIIDHLSQNELFPKVCSPLFI